MKLLDNTLLSNFIHVNRLDLIAIALPEASITPQVMVELNEGETSGRLPPSDWSWLTVISLSPEEIAHFEQFRLILDDGEASCLAVALARKGVFFSDDRDARRYAQKLGVTVSGTLGVLALSVRNRQITLVEADTLLEAMIEAGYYSPVNSLAEIYDFDE